MLITLSDYGKWFPVTPKTPKVLRSSFPARPQLGQQRQQVSTLDSSTLIVVQFDNDGQPTHFMLIPRKDD